MRKQLETIWGEAAEAEHRRLTGEMRRWYIAADIAIWASIVFLICFAFYIEWRF